MLGFPLLYLKGMRLMMFQLSGFYCYNDSKSVSLKAMSTRNSICRKRSIPTLWKRFEKPRRHFAVAAPQLEFRELPGSLL